MKSRATHIKKSKNGNDTISESASLNQLPNKQELSIEKLRSYNGFENVSDDEAEEHVKLIKTFARILYDIYQQENKKDYELHQRLYSICKKQ